MNANKANSLGRQKSAALLCFLPPVICGVIWLKDMESIRPMRINEQEGDRFELALEQFENGEFIVFRGTGFGLRKTELEIRAPIEWTPENVDHNKAEQVISRASDLLNILKDASKTFNSLVAKLPVRIVVLYDYGMGGIEIAESLNGEFSWHAGYPKTKSAR